MVRKNHYARLLNAGCGGYLCSIAVLWVGLVGVALAYKWHGGVAWTVQDARWWLPLAEGFNPMWVLASLFIFGKETHDLEEFNRAEANK